MKTALRSIPLLLLPGPECWSSQPYYWPALDSDRGSVTSNQQAMWNTPAICRPSTQQRAIADVLGALDDKIELNRRMIGVADIVADRLFDEWARATVEPAPARTVAELDRCRRVDDWRWVPGQEQRVGPPRDPVRAGGRRRWRCSRRERGCACSGSIAAAGDKISRALDVVVTTKGTVGRIAQVAEGTPTVVYSPQLCYWRVLDHAALDPHILYRWMRSSAFAISWNATLAKPIWRRTSTFVTSAE